MAVYALSDPHLSLSVPKPMDVFGGKWNGYTEKLEKNLSKLSEEDTVVMPGDISWAMRSEELIADLSFLEALPGKKILGKGNHDYWWATMSKLSAFVEENGFTKIRFLYNNAYVAEDVVICGSRGWYLDAEVPGCDNKKIIQRECGRLDMSIKAAKVLAEKNSLGTPVVFTHYPPLFGDYRCDEILEVLLNHGIEKCYFGHLHGVDESRLIDSFEGIKFTLCAADHLNFAPIRIN